MKKIFIIVILYITLLTSCESPLDLDTPRDKILPNPVDSVQLTLLSMSVETNGITENFIISNVMLEIDTSSKNPILWGQLDIKSSIVTNFGKSKLELASALVNFKNLPITGTPIILGALNYEDSFAKYEINRGVNASYNKTIISDKLYNKTEITFSLERSSKKFWIYLDAQIKDDRFYITDNNTNNIDSIPDILYIKGRFQFTY